MSSNNFNFEQQRTRESSRLNIMNITNNTNNKNQTRRICLINNNATIDGSLGSLRLKLQVIPLKMISLTGRVFTIVSNLLFYLLDINDL